MRVSVHSRRAAYAALGVLTLIWGLNWIAMKGALLHTDPLTFNVHRTWLAMLVLFAVLVARRRHFWPHSWRAVVITAFFQTTINFGATTMAVAGGGAGRTSVLVFTMPFWTLLIAWPVLHERVRGLQLAAIAFAFAGLMPACPNDSRNEPGVSGGCATCAAFAGALYHFASVAPSLGTGPLT